MKELFGLYNTHHIPNLLRKILSYGAIEGIAKALNKLIVLLLPLLLFTEDFGRIGLIISLETLLPLVTLLGLERAILRFYSKKEEIQNFDRTIETAIKGTHSLLIVLLIILYLSGVKILFGLNIFPDIFLIIILVYLQGSNLFTLNRFRVNEEHSKYYAARLFLQVSKFSLILLFIFVTGNYLGYLIGGIIVAAATNIIFRNKYVIKAGTGQFFDQTSFKMLFNFSWPFILHGIAGNLLGNADKFIINRFLTISDVGLYTFAYSIGSMIVFAYVGISVYMEPLIYKQQKEKQMEAMLEKYKIFAISMGLFVYIFICLISDFILPRFYPNYSDVLYLIPLIAVSYLIYPYYLTSNYRMIYKKKSKNIAIMSIITCIINIGLNFILIPIYGLFAAVVVTLLSFAIQAFIFQIGSTKFKFSSDLLMILLISGIIFFLVYFNCNHYITAIILFMYFMSYYFLKRTILSKWIT